MYPRYHNIKRPEGEPLKFVEVVEKLHVIMLDNPLLFESLIPILTDQDTIDMLLALLNEMALANEYLMQKLQELSGRYSPIPPAVLTTLERVYDI